ncbi:unnamed protein product, partial [Discosporangium mesarthrocarpum]
SSLKGRTSRVKKDGKAPTEEGGNNLLKSFGFKPVDSEDHLAQIDWSLKDSVTGAESTWAKG